MTVVSKIHKFLKTLAKTIISRNQRIDKISYKEVKKDISISTDKILNEKITSFLSKEFSFPILSEEAETQTSYEEFKDCVWIIDPLDGSLNYLRQIPFCCISIALWQKSQPILGMIYDFNRDELFVGNTQKTTLTGSKGAWLNHHPIHVSKIAEKSQGVICTGFPSWRNYKTDSLLNFVKKVQDWKKVRLLGSAALSLAWTAAGRVEAYFEEDIRIWDVAAGLTIVKAAGGDILIKPSPKKNFVTAIAINGKIPITNFKI